MEAEPVTELPAGKGWPYEPKYDGFRCLAFRDGDDIQLQSKKQKSLNRFFPEIVAGLASPEVDRYVLDSEIIIPGHGFETLQLRLHPAASRAAMLAKEYPAKLIVFDLLAFGNANLTARPLAERRQALEDFVKRVVGKSRVLSLSRATQSAVTARKWQADIGKGLDGIVAKRLDEPYRPGERAIRKFKLWHTIDAVLAGYYEDKATRTIESLLFGLYGDDGLLHFAGHSRVYDDAAEIARLLAPLKGGTGFTGRTPGGKSRWTGKVQKMIRLQPILVAELSADHISGGQFRHGSRLIRWRTDKAPEDCKMDQIER